MAKYFNLNFVIHYILDKDSDKANRLSLITDYNYSDDIKKRIYY